MGACGFFQFLILILILILIRMNRCFDHEKTGRLRLRLRLGLGLPLRRSSSGLSRRASPPARNRLQAAPTHLFPHPLSRAEAVDIALRQNSAILKGKADLEAAHGVVVQLRSIAFPTLSAQGAYNAEQSSLVENFPLPAPFNNFVQFPTQNWNSDIRVQQSIYEGGRMTSAFRSAKLTRQQALLNYQTLLADTLLSVRVAYDDVLVAQQQIAVNEASVKLLTHELEDVRRRFQAGTVPQFDVLRAHVELANESSAPHSSQKQLSHRQKQPP